MAILIGFESANSYVKALSSVNNEVDTYKNTLTRINSRKAAMDSAQKNYRKDVYEVNGEFYKVGQEAISQKQKSSSKDDYNRYDSEKYEIESIIAIYRQLERATNDVFSENVYVVTGVPSNHADLEEEVVKPLTKRLKKEHTVNGKNFVVKGVKVVEQGLSSYYDELLDDRGNPVASFVNRIEGNHLAYIDIGHGSTDIQWIGDMIKQDSQYTRGMKSVWEMLKADGNENARFKSDSLPILGLETTFQNTGLLETYGLDLREKRAQYMKDYAVELIDLLNEGDFTDSIFSEVVFTGGGSLGLRRFLEEVIQENYDVEIQRKRFRFMDEPQSSNARGYLKYAFNYFPEVEGVNV